MFGLSAAFAGKWLEHVGLGAARCSPRHAASAEAFLISALGVYLHQIVLLYLGYGVIGGIGLGLLCIAGVDADPLVPDAAAWRLAWRSWAFGGGAMIAAPLSVALMNHFRSATSIGVVETFIVLGIAYFISMSIGVLAIRVPPADWKDVRTPPAPSRRR